MSFSRPRHWLRWLITAIVIVVVLAVAGPFVYIHFFNGSTPTALSLTPSGSASASAGSSASSTPAATTAASGFGGRNLERRFRFGRRLPGQRGPGRAEHHRRRPQHVSDRAPRHRGYHRDGGQLHRPDGDGAQRQERAGRPVRQPDHGRGQVPDRDLRPDQPDRPRAAARDRGDQELHRAREADAARHHPRGDLQR